jgi:replicative DNA helicase
MPTQVLRTGFLTEAHWKGIAHASGPLSEMLVSLNDSSTISVLEMRAQARRLKADGACKLVVIDHLQMIQPRTRHENRTQELSGIIRDVKSMAKELDVPVIVVSQLSRAAEMSGAARPQLRHLRDSGELEQVADVVLFLYREEYHDPEAAQQHNTENLCEVIIAKNRNGALKTVKLFFDREHARFTNLEDHREE